MVASVDPGGTTGRSTAVPPQRVHSEDVVRYKSDLLAGS
jgi:hypothetical protein